MNQHLGHVYLVDDDPDVRFYLSDLLRHLGYTVAVYESAESFFQQALDLSPAVVLMDVRMPGLTGVQAQQHLTTLGHSTPVVFISGQSQPQEIIDALKGGAVDFLIKPFNREQLVAALERALKQDRQHRDRFVRQIRVQRLLDTLTEREKEVFSLMLQGHTNLAIGDITGVQAGTIKKHRASVLDKFGVKNVAQIMQMCRELNLADQSVTQLGIGTRGTA